MPKRKSTVKTRVAATVTCPTCATCLQLIDQLKGLYADERDARESAEERHRTEREMLLTRIAEEAGPPRAASARHSTPFTRERPVGPRPVEPGAVSHPPSLVDRIEMARITGPDRQDRAAIAAAMDAAILGRAPKTVETPEAIADEEATDERVLDDLLAAAVPGKSAE